MNKSYIYFLTRLLYVQVYGKEEEEFVHLVREFPLLFSCRLSFFLLPSSLATASFFSRPPSASDFPNKILDLTREVL